MPENIFIQNSSLALVLGFIIGLQREMRNYRTESKEFGGGRTFAIIAFLGYLSAFLGGFSPYFLPFSFLVIGSLLVAAKITLANSEKPRGSTTEFSALSAFLIGSMLNFIEPKFVVFSAVVLLLVLNLKDKIQELEKYIGKDDLNAAILFLTMSFVVLPVLPDKTIDSFGLFNPYKIWLMVVLIAGISFAGYIAVRVLGTDRGIVFTGLIGGLVSSTAVALSLSKKASAVPSASGKIAVGIMLASTVMIVRATLLVSLFNANLLADMWFAFAATFVVAAGVVVYYFFKNKTEDFKGVEIEYKNPFDLKEAMILGLSFGAIVALVKLSKEYVGNSGIYVVSILSGITDVDAIILSLSQVAGNGLEFSVAAFGIMAAVSSNSASKFMICFFAGSKELVKTVAVYYSAVTLTFAAALYI